LSRIPEIATVEEYAAIYGEASAEMAEVEAMLREYREYKPMSEKLPNDWALLLHRPAIARKLLALDRYIDQEMTWAQRRDLRELAIEVVNQRYRCHYSHVRHMNAGLEAGLRPVQLAALYFRSSEVFSEEQRLVIAVVNGVIDNDLPEELFARAKSSYGERGTVEFMTVICYWSWWAMTLNVLRPMQDEKPAAELSTQTAKDDPAWQRAVKEVGTDE
jgi:alkylhydroperoxidase family enzyme